jgi:hypothetical protein
VGEQACNFSGDDLGAIMVYSMPRAFRDTSHSVKGSGLPDLHSSVYSIMGGVKIAPDRHRNVVPFLEILLGDVRFANDYSEESIRHLG